MNDSKSTPSQPQATGEEVTSALFASMVVQQTNMALMFLGQVPHPQSGETVRDLDAAKMFIDQLEMLEVKTKGNLLKHEEALLKRNLTALRMAFVEASHQPAKPASKPEPAPAPTPGPAPSADAAAAEGASSPDDAESRKKFSKKY